jgi:hypothetical protein
MSPVGDSENRSLSEIDCGDEFRTAIAKFNGAQNATKLQTQSSPLDDDSSDDDSCWAAEHTLNETA